MAMDLTVTDRVKALICEQLGVTTDQAADAADLRDDLGCDSLDIVELVNSLEDEFAIKISDEEGDKLVIVQDVVIIVQTKLAGSKA